VSRSVRVDTIPTVRLPRLASLPAAALVAVLLAGCAPEVTATEVVYRVRSLDGAAPTEADMTAARGRLEVRLLGAGYERNDVSIMGPDRVRVVLPENVAAKMPEIRALLEDPDDLPVRIEAVER